MVAAALAAGFGSTGPSIGNDGLSSGSGLRKLDATEERAYPMRRRQPQPTIKGAIDGKALMLQPTTERYVARVRLDAGAERGGHRGEEAPG